MLLHSFLADKLFRLREGAASFCQRASMRLRSKPMTRGQIAVAAAAALLPLSAALATLTTTGLTSAQQEKASAAVSAAASPRSASTVANPSETTASLLARLGINDPELEKFIYSNADASAFAIPRRGSLVEASVSPDCRADSISIYSDGKGGRNLKTTISRNGGALSAASAPFEWEKRASMAAVKVGKSFAADAAAAGIPESVIRSASQVSYRDKPLLDKAGKGDTVSVIFDNHYLDGRFVSNGRLLGVSLEHGSETVRLYWFKDGTADGGFYLANGDTTGQSFLRYPLNAFKLTSRFSYGRRHPVLGRVRPHKGIDLSAPTGTPVHAVSDGVVTAADRSLSGYGNHVDIQHGGNIVSRYAHLSGYAKGIRPGVPVVKGQLIGYCGSSGIATGPHVHYEILRNGSQVDPLAAGLPMDSRLSPDYYAAGRRRVAGLEKDFQKLGSLRAAAGGKTIPVMDAPGKAGAVASSGARSSSGAKNG